MTGAVYISLLAQDAPSGSAFPGLLMAVGVLAVGLSIWFSLRKKLKRGFVQARESSSERIERVRAKATHGQRERIETYMTDAEELTRRLAAILDNKAERAEAMINTAEKRLAELEGRLSAPEITTRRVEPAATFGAHPGAHPVSAPAPDAIRYEAADPVAVDIYRLADEGRTSIEIARELDEHTGKVELILALRE